MRHCLKNWNEKKKRSTGRLGDRKGGKVTEGGEERGQRETGRETEESLGELNSFFHNLKDKSEGEGPKTLLWRRY